jgi:hypothetical protein
MTSRYLPSRIKVYIVEVYFPSCIWDREVGVNPIPPDGDIIDVMGRTEEVAVLPMKVVAILLAFAFSVIEAILLFY